MWLVELVIRWIATIESIAAIIDGFDDALLCVLDVLLPVPVV